MQIISKIFYCILFSTFKFNEELVKKLHFCYKNIGGRIIRKNKESLASNSKESICAWKKFFKEIF